MINQMQDLSIEKNEDNIDINHMFKKFQSYFFESWWVILFALICFALFEQGMYVHTKEFSKLSMQLRELQQHKIIAFSMREKLLLQLNSESDPMWVELVLMRVLGMVPEGQEKVFFSNPE